MQDYELSILEQYPIIVKSTRKTRGAFFCDTDQGFLLLREAGIRHIFFLVLCIGKGKKTVCTAENVCYTEIEMRSERRGQNEQH